MYTHCSDTEILTLIRAGNSTAFGTLHTRYSKSAVRAAYKITKDLQASEDIVQDIFLNLWKSRATIEIEDISKYLFTCVKYGSVRYLSKRTRTYMPGEELPEAAAGVTPEDVYNGKFLQQCLQLAIDRLPEKCRIVFIESKVKGLTAKQIAAEQGISARTVEKQLENGMGKVKKSLEKVASLFFLAIISFF